MKTQTKGKEKDKQSSISMKSRIIVIEERIRQEIRETEELQIKYATVQDNIEKMKRIQNTHTRPEVTCSEKHSHLTELIATVTRMLNDFHDKTVSEAYNTISNQSTQEKLIGTKKYYQNKKWRPAATQKTGVTKMPNE